MFQNHRKLIRYIIVGVLVVGIVSSVITYFVSTRTVAITSKNSTSFSLSEQDKKTSRQMAATKTSVRIKKGKTYILSYVGASGYANGEMTITPTTETITINPDYSTEKLNKMLDADITAINTTITASGTSIDTLYTIQRGELSHYGEWYFTTLMYNGSAEDASSDTLVVGLQKKGGVWTAILTPNIIFTTSTYPTVSRDFIEAANEYQSNHVSPREESYYQ